MSSLYKNVVVLDSGAGFLPFWSRRWHPKFPVQHSSS